MQSRTRIRTLNQVGLLLVVAVLALGGAGPQKAMAAPEATVSFDLWAMPGTLGLPDGTTVPVWGYAPTGAGPAQVPGPALVATQGDTVNVTLHNGLAVTTGLYFEGLAMLPDLAGVPAGGSKTYTFAVADPGIFLYEAGLLPGAAYQPSMGLHGALIVRPLGAPGQAYANPATAFDVEAPLVLSEIDPALNNAADPAAFDMRDYAARYFLFNGKAYPQTGPIVAAGGQKLLLRYVNAGQRVHPIATLGMYQQFLSLGGVELPFYRTMTSELLAPGQSADALLTVPMMAAGGLEGIDVPPTRYALYDASMLLHNNGAKDANGLPLYGGMLTFIQTADDPGSPQGPETSNLLLTPNPANGTMDVTVTATVSDVGRGDNPIAAAELYIDDTMGGMGMAMTAADGAFDTPTEAVEGMISVADMAGLAAGPHTIYVRGMDNAGFWGTFNFVVLNLDKAGPMTSGIQTNPAASRGTVDVAIQATGDDSQTGNSNVTAGQYRVVDCGANLSGALTPNLVAPVVSLGGTIPTANMGTLAEGTHVLSARSQDALGNWGTWADGSLIVDKAGPQAGNVKAYPNPNNGTLGVNPITPSVRMDVRLKDLFSGTCGGGARTAVATAEGFIDTVGLPGSGFPFTPLDGLFDQTTEDAYAFIPLSTINALSEGRHTFYVRGKDAAGNWGLPASTIFTLDKTVPAVSNVAANPNPINTQATFDLTATAADPNPPGPPVATNIAAAEWFEGTDPGRGLGKPMVAADGAFDNPTEVVKATIDVNGTGWAAGTNHTLYVRAKDAAGNWSPTGSVVVVVNALPNAIFSDGFESGSFSAWTASTGTSISVTTAAKRSGSYGMQALISGNTPGYVTNGTPVLDASYHARFYFNANAMSTAGAAITIFSGQNAAGTAIFQLQYQANAQGDGRVRLAVLRTNGNSVTNYYNITKNAFNAIEIAWASGNSASASLYVNGTLRQTLTGLNTSAYKLDAVQLGPTAGLNANMAGTLYFDDFVSTRTTPIGP